jgi:cytochrome c551/c552
MKNYLFAFVIILSSCGGNNEKSTTEQKAIETGNTKGEELFKASCAQCHLPQKDFVGPSLAGVESRWENKELLYDFVRNSGEVIKRDKYAADLFEKWNNAPMLPNPQLTNEDIKAILAFCNSVAD